MPFNPASGSFPQVVLTLVCVMVGVIDFWVQKFLLDARGRVWKPGTAERLALRGIQRLKFFKISRAFGSWAQGIIIKGQPDLYKWLSLLLIVALTWIKIGLVSGWGIVPGIFDYLIKHHPVTRQALGGYFGASWTVIFAGLGYALFFLKKKSLMEYAYFELGFALGSCYLAVNKSMPFGTQRLAYIAGATYLVVRALDNRQTALERRYVRISN